MALSKSVLFDPLDAFRAGEGVNLVRIVMQGVIEAEATEQIGAARYERNGSRPRLVATRAGDIELRIPKLHKGSFFPSILEPSRRIDQPLYAVGIEAHVNGVSTRSVDDFAATHDEWQAGDRHYLSEGSRSKLYPDCYTGAVAELNTGD